MIVVPIPTGYLTPLVELASKRKTLYLDSLHPTEQQLTEGTAAPSDSHGSILVIRLLSWLLSPNGSRIADRRLT